MSQAIRLPQKVAELQDWNQSTFLPGYYAKWDDVTGRFVGANLPPPITNHAQLTNLDYTSSGHTGFVPSTLTITAGTGLSGGGDLSTNRTISLPSIGIPGTYGDGSHYPIITVDDRGRVTGVATQLTTTGAVSSFNTRTGAVTLTAGDVTGALGYSAIARLDIANTFAAGPNLFQSGTPDNISLLAQGAASQSVDIFQVQNSGTVVLLTVTAAGLAGINTGVPIAALDIRSPTVATVSTGSGTNAATLLSIGTATGGTTNDPGTATGGAGGNITVTTGTGGLASSAAVQSTGGAGGTYIYTGGSGGAATVAGTGNNTGGVGGVYSIVIGTGGAASGATTGTNTGGVGGSISFRAGTGGVASNGGTNNPGAAGTVTILGGTAAAQVGAFPGSITIQGGTASSTGSGGGGAAVIINGSNAAGDGTVGRTGGGATITSGSSIAAAGGAINITPGGGGNNLTTGTATGFGGGVSNINGGTGGQALNATISATGGGGGTPTLQGGTGGAAAVAGTGNNIGGSGGSAQVIAGIGGNATGATTGTNTAGAGGGVTIRGGTAGISSSGGTNTANGGGTVSISGGLAAAQVGSTGGNISIVAGAGTSTGAGGAGGVITITGGSAGGDNTSSRSGGAVTVTAGTSKGDQTGATATVQGGTGAPGTGTTGSIGGQLVLLAGAGGVGSATGGAGGGVFIKGGLGGNSTTPGAGGSITFQTGPTTTLSGVLTISNQGASVFQLATGATVTSKTFVSKLLSGQTGALIEGQDVAGSPLFTVSSTGDLTKLKGVTYVWPGTQGGASTLLTNDGAGNLTWSALASATVTTALGYTPVAPTRQVLAGTGLSGGGSLTADVTLSLPNVGVASTYGDSTHYPIITTDAQGRVTGVSVQAITAGVTSFNTRTGDVLLTLTDVTSALGYTPVATARQVLAGTGLSGGGNLAADVTLSLPNVGTAGTYGDATHYPIVTTDAQGRSSVTSQAIGPMTYNTDFTQAGPRTFNPLHPRYGGVGDGVANEDLAFSKIFTDIDALTGTPWCEIVLPANTHWKITTTWSRLGKPLRIVGGHEATIDWYGTNPNPSTAITAATNASPIQITATAHGLAIGDFVYVTGVLGNTAANGWYTVASVVDANNVTLAQSTGNGAYTSGGTIQKMIPVIKLGYASADVNAAKANSQPIVLEGVRIRNNDGITAPMNNSFIALCWQNIYSGIIRDAAIDGFGIGWNPIGDGTGCTTSSIVFRQIKNCGVGAYFFANNSGYVTQMGVGPGDWTYSVQTGKRVWHVKAELGPTGSNVLGGNTFIDTCFQAQDANAFWAQIQTGDHWYFDCCHFETVNHSAVPLIFGSTCTDCQVIRSTGPVTDLQVQDQSTSSPGNIFLLGGFRPWVRLYASTTNAGPNAVTAATSLIGTGVGVFGSSQAAAALPAYFMNRGRKLRGKAWGWITTDATTPASVSFILTIGTNTWTFPSSGTLAAGLNNSLWVLEFEAIQRVIGSGTSARIQVFGEYRMTNVANNAKTTAPIVGGTVSAGGTTDDNTLSKVVNLTATLSAAATNNLQCEQFTLDAS